MKRPSEFGRCPCRSGSLYKECCGLLPPAPCDGVVAIAEDRAIGPALEVSKELRVLRKRERALLDTVVWGLDRDLPEGIYARNTKVRGRVCVYFPRVPVRDPISVAHEICHLLHNREGLPLTGSRNDAGEEWHSVSSALNGIVTHPSIHQLLGQYGFDVESRFQEEERLALPGMRGATPDRDPRRALWVMNYANHKRQAEDLGVESKVCARIEEREPAIAADGQELVDFIRANGVDSIERRVNFFDYAVQSHSLAPMIGGYRP